MQEWFEPMRAVLSDERFSNDLWLFEPKLDGERVLTFRDGPSLRLYSRNHRPLNRQYPELTKALRAQSPDSCILDGEVVAFKPGTAVTSFSVLQQRMHVDDPSPELLKASPVFYYLFDLLFHKGKDLRRSPLLERKRLLESSVTFKDPLRYLSHRRKTGEAYYQQACRSGWEGLIAKRVDSPYRSVRSRDWLKWKCVNEQEMVIGGYSDPQGSRTAFGSLLLGYYENRRLRFAGKVGTGFDNRTLQFVSEQLHARDTDQCPFISVDIPRRGLHWVKPTLVAQVGYSEWTSDGKLRHPRFLGLRDDKSAEEVTLDK